MAVKMRVFVMLVKSGGENEKQLTRTHFPCFNSQRLALIGSPRRRRRLFFFSSHCSRDSNNNNNNYDNTSINNNDHNGNNNNRLFDLLQ